MPFPYRRVHMIGIGGAGMSAIAEALLFEGVKVSGSDLEQSPYTERLQQKGATIFIGHSADQITDVNAVIISSAISHDNPELVEARKRNITVLHRAESLALLMEGKESICVAGTHGKSTTTAMIGHIFAYASCDPTVIVGAEVRDFNSNCRVGTSNLFISEADESDGSFLKLTPNHSIITNVELDHPDHYSDEKAFMDAFVQFADRLSEDGLLVINSDCPNLRQLPFKLKRSGWWMNFGLHNEADYEGRLRLLRKESSLAWVMQVRRRPKLLGDVQLKLPGEHNAANALGALVVCMELGVPFSVCAEALANFQGVKRRFEIIDTVQGVTIVDDYAHHPTEVKALVKTARQVFPEGRIWVIFQPHRYTRTLRFWQDFGSAFEDADGLWVTDIFSASEAPVLNVSGELIAQAVKSASVSKTVHYTPNWEHILQDLTKFVQKGDVVLVVGAGDIYKLAVKLKLALSNFIGVSDKDDVGR